MDIFISMSIFTEIKANFHYYFCIISVQIDTEK